MSRSPALAAALLALVAAAPARAADRALLWIPAETFSAWKDFDAAMSAGGARLTVAVSPALMTPAAVASLKSWADQGRVEIALRLDGDPILPVIASLPVAPRPQDVTDRLATARERYREAFGRLPAGFAPGGGAISADILPGLKAMGLSWVAAGDYAGAAGGWVSVDGLAVAPLRAWPADGPAVVDEADGAAPVGTLLRLLSYSGGSTLSQAAAAAAPTAKAAAGVKDWPTWNGPLSSWTDGARARRAWTLYGAAARAVERYQNSGLANLRALDRAAADLQGAQANRFYRDVPPEQAPALDQDLRSRLLAVYRRIRVSAPDDLFAASGATAAGSTGQAADQPTGVHVTQGADWVEFENPSGSAARVPEDAGAAAGAASYTLRKLRVEGSADAVTFTYQLGALSPDASLRPAPATPELGLLLLETDIDLNHVAGAGATGLVSDRAAFIQSRDAWEYALVVSAWGASLYRSIADGEPYVVARPQIAADPKTGQVVVTVPRSALPGNPLRWGFVASSFEADPATAVRQPVRPRTPTAGTAILGLLAPLEQQKLLADPSAHPRLAAARASERAAN